MPTSQANVVPIAPDRVISVSRFDAAVLEARDDFEASMRGSGFHTVSTWDELSKPNQLALQAFAKRILSEVDYTVLDKPG